MLTYTTLDGTAYDLSGLPADRRAFLDRCLRLYREDAPWVDFARLIEGTENPLLRETGGTITREVWLDPLWRALRDLEDRLGIRQRKVIAMLGDDLMRDPVADDEWLPVSEAAARKGVSIAGLHKAIARGDVIARPAKPGGSWLVVSANSLAHWRPSPARQTAGRARAAVRPGDHSTVVAAGVVAEEPLQPVAVVLGSGQVRHKPGCVLRSRAGRMCGGRARAA